MEAGSVGANNVVQLHPEKRKPQMITYVNDIKESDEMSEDKYITKQEFQNLEDKIDLKITVAVQPLEAKIDNLGTQIDGKFNTLEQKIENMFLKQKVEIQKERKENIKWIVGTAIALVSLVAAIVTLL